ncbi:MAG: small ribosomal subunit biogenesis GTPase RsgA [Aphanothece sp. CMT-3BRIN-NPC111]|jgi:ribosome biogenesis GTPase|nr:small ribosomal subunit biogenesis GTPase RsgA [Aphanothece sp. CMT-3BRIN-NPC111]
MSFELEEPLNTQTSELSKVLGTVLAVQANYYQVRVDSREISSTQNSVRAGLIDESGVETEQSFNITPPTTQNSKLSLLCTRRSRLKKIGSKVMVGDRVEIEEPDWAGGRGAIAQVLPRQTELDRPPIANANQILLVFALADPPLDAYQLSRFLVKAESTSLEVCLCLNKSDLVTNEQQQQWRDRLKQWGYQPLFISVYTNTGLDELNNRLSNKISVFAGLSGVGKSSIINYLVPYVNIRVAEVSGKLNRGRHTTRHVELFELPSGGLLADTPGFNQPDIDFTPEELAAYFPEAKQRLATDRCQFSNCLHRNEPNCAVRGDWERYEHYLDFLEEAIARQDFLNQQANPESTLKLKSKAGKSQYEPKLETKKYRRISRRTQQQELQELYKETDF